MKILISIGTLGLGGAEKQAVWLANSLSDLHEVTLLTYQGGVREKDLSPKVNWRTIYEIRDKEKNEEIDSQGLIIEEQALPQSLIKVGSNAFYEFGTRESESVTSIFRLRLLEEKVKTSLKNFPLTFKLLRYLYIKSMPIIQFSRLILRLRFKSFRECRSSLSWKNFSKRSITLVFKLIAALMTRFLRLVGKPLLYLTLPKLRQNIKNHSFVFRKARKTLKGVEPDLVITFLFHDTVNIGLAAITQIHRPKLIVGRRSPIGYGDDSRNWFYKLILRYVYKFAYLAVSNSESNFESAIHDGLAPSKIVYINNFVNYQDSQLQLNDSPVVSLICIANFFEYKNHRNLIRALAMINENRNFEVTLVGEGPTREEMILLTSELKLNAFFYTHDDQKKVGSFKADFLLLPSFFEGSSNALLEGLAKGIPAIVTNVGLVPTLKKMGAPLVVSKGTDAKSLHSALLDGLASQSKLRCDAENFKMKVENEFSEKKILSDWLEVVEGD
jgi:glycosyltransferase involved in cell wall biosynthesis